MEFLVWVIAIVIEPLVAIKGKLEACGHFMPHDGFAPGPLMGAEREQQSGASGHLVSSLQSPVPVLCAIWNCGNFR